MKNYIILFLFLLSVGLGVYIALHKHPEAIVFPKPVICPEPVICPDLPDPVICPDPPDPVICPDLPDPVVCPDCPDPVISPTPTPSPELPDDCWRWSDPDSSEGSSYGSGSSILYPFHWQQE